MNAILRYACPEDAEVLGRLHYTCWQETYRGLLPDGCLDKMSPEKSEKIFRATGCRDLIVAICGGEIIGECGFGASRDGDLENCGEIQGIYVLKKFQRRGIGRRLIELALDRIASRGYNKVCLWVLKGNEKAEAFYRAEGFLPDGAEKTQPFNEIRYVADIKR